MAADTLYSIHGGHFEAVQPRIFCSQAGQGSTDRNTYPCTSNLRHKPFMCENDILKRRNVTSYILGL